MERQTQYFQIANLIFSSPYNKTITLNGAEISEIQNRFQIIVKSFEGNNINHSSSFIKNDSELPYNAMTIVGEINNHLILHFTFSYKEPVLFIVDTAQNKVKNFIDIEEAKGILDNEIFEDIREELSHPRNLDRLFKNISDINKFVEKFNESLQNHVNPDMVTGRDCFEVDLDEYEL